VIEYMLSMYETLSLMPSNTLPEKKWLLSLKPKIKILL
jgi:hypothetical protein